MIDYNTIPQEFQNQLEKFYNYLKDKELTATQVSVMLGIPQKNICRYKRVLEKQDLLWEVKYVKCPLTGFMAWTITTDPSRKPKDNQLQLELI